MDHNKELKLLSEYLDFYIQMLPQLPKAYYHQLPTFKDFKERYEYFTESRFKHSIYIKNDKLCNNYARGLGTDNGAAYRYYNTYLGKEYFTNGNIQGNFIIVDKELNNHLKHFK